MAPNLEPEEVSRAVRVLITGGAGFIGANLSRMLTSEPRIDEVIVLDNLINGRRENLDGVDVTFLRGDICDPATVDRAMEGVTSVVHLAALGSVPRSIDDPLSSHHNNATGTLQVLEGARRAGNAHVIVASSSSVYGATEELPKHEALPVRPLSPYGASKLATEWYALAHQSSMELPVLAFRFFNVFGPLQAAEHVYAAVIPRFVSAALKGEPVTVHGDGLQSRDFTYVDDVCRTITRAVMDRVTNEGPVNLAYGRPHTILDVVGMIGEILDRSIEVEHGPTRPGDVRHSDADSTLLHHLFPGTEPTPIESGLASTIRWFQD